MLIATDEAPAAHCHNRDGVGPVVLICEHASKAIPRAFNGLGLSPEIAQSHAAWDPGALEVALHLSTILDAPIVAANWSRLVFDLNREPSSPEAMRETSEIYAIPGNHGLTAADKAARTQSFYDPFHHAISALMDQRDQAGMETILVTVHSFTPVFHGVRRSVELGILHDDDARIADILLNSAAKFTNMKVARNEPYGPADGVTHTLRRHRIERGLHNAMIEIRNDLIATGHQQNAIADELGAMLQAALPLIGEKPLLATGRV